MDCRVRYPRSVGVRMHYWHAGQGDLLYAVGSQIHAGRAVAFDDIYNAIGQLESISRRASTRKNKHAARALAQTLRTRAAVQCPGFALDGVKRRRRRKR